MKLGATQPSAFEAVPEQDRIHLPSKLIDSPDAVILYYFACTVEWQAVELAKRVHLIPMLADVTVLESNMVRAVSSAARSGSARIKALALHQGLGNARDCLADSARLI